MVKKPSAAQRKKMHDFRDEILQRIELRGDAAPWWGYLGPMLPWDTWLQVAAPMKALIPLSNPRLCPEYKKEEVKGRKSKKQKVGTHFRYGGNDWCVVDGCVVDGCVVCK
jgi:hypothetical protein